MPRRSTKPSTTTEADLPLDAAVAQILQWLERTGTETNREGMARYAITAEKVFGVSVNALRGKAKELGRSHALAAALWDTGWYEARMLATMVDDPQQVTPGQMDRWARDFDNWAICDTACFQLFDRTPHAWKKIEQWSGKKAEFVRRAGFALLASVALHHKQEADEPFLKSLPLIESAAGDDRNFVKKGVSWALRSIGRRSPALHAAALELAGRLAESKDPAARWIGKDALRDLSKAAVTNKLAAKSGRRR